MPLDGRCAEALVEPVHELARQRDFRQHDEDLTAALQRACDGLEIDLCLAGAGDAVEQQGAAAGVCQGFHGMDGCRLGIGELHFRMMRLGLREALLGDRDLDEDARLHEAIDDAGRALGLGRERALGPHHAVGGDVDGAPAFGGHARRLCGALVDLDAEARLLRLEDSIRAHHHAHDHAEWRQRVARDPLGETQGQLGQRRHLVQDVGDGLELLVGDGLAGVADGPVPGDADAALGAEGHDHELPGGGRIAFDGHQVIVGLVERHGQQDGHARARAGRRRPFPLQTVEQAYQDADPVLFSCPRQGARRRRTDRPER